MQTTSGIWKALWAAGAPLETRAVIAGTVTADSVASAPMINRSAMQNGVSIGNVAAASLSLIVRGAEGIPRSAEVVVETRLNDGETASEWLPQGTFYIARRARDPVSGLMALECYDALLKAQAIAPGLPWTTKGGEPVTTRAGELILFRRAIAGSMLSVARGMAALLGVALDPRSNIREGPLYEITSMPEGSTIRDVLSVIAQANGGNWVITPRNTLRLVPLADAAGATEDALEVDGVTENIVIEGTGVVTGIRSALDDGSCLVGDDTGIVLDVNIAPALAAELGEAMIGRRYQAYSLTGAVCDPAAELGDFVRAGANGEIASALYSQQIALGPAPRCEIAAPGGGEVTDEYPYIGAGQRTLALAKAYVNRAVEALDDGLDQREIFNRLTDNGAAQGLLMADGQLYINATYINTGGFNADLITSGSINADLIRSGSINADLITSGTMNANRIRGGTLTLGTSNNGKMHVNFATSPFLAELDVNSTGFTIHTNQIYGGEDHHSYINLGFKLDSVSSTTTAWRCDPINISNAEMLDDSTASTVLNCGGISIYNDHYSTNKYNPFFKVGYPNFSCKADALFNNIRAEGTKSRQVSTDQYSDRLLYCYETPSPLFGDVGEGVIGEDGICYVTLDAVFAETIATNQYQVFLQKYGPGDCWVKARKGSHFVIEGTPGLLFGWEIKAKQRDYDQLRLERNDEQFTVPIQSYGKDAAKHIGDIRKEREAA